MGTLQIIMPKENQRSNQLLVFGLDAGIDNYVLQFAFQRGLGIDARPGTGTKLRNLSRSEQGLNRRGKHSHATNYPRNEQLPRDILNEENSEPPRYTWHEAI